MPSWDYESDGTANPSAASGAIFGGALGAIIGGSFGLTAAVGGMREGIEMTPAELSTVILRALSGEPNRRPQTAISFTPTGTNRSRSSWPVAESKEGQITTDWKGIPGKKAGILWWEKEYETQVRHIITIQPSFRSSRQANYSILTEVRERPNAQYGPFHLFIRESSV